MKYSDPENIQDICKDIMKLQTVKEIYDLLLSIYPGIVINVMDSYSNDYPHFEINWSGICDTLKVKKAQIIVLDEYPEDDSHLLLKIFSEVLTQAGFVLRKYTEFIPCTVCNRALPNNYIYYKLKENKIKVPESWSTKCSNC